MKHRIRRLAAPTGLCHASAKLARGTGPVQLSALALAGLIALPAGAALHASRTGFYTPADSGCCSTTFQGNDISSAINVATSDFTGTPGSVMAGATASATSVVGAKRAAVSFTATSSDTSGVTAGEIKQLTGAYDNTTFVNFGLEPPRELVSVASETTTLYTGGSSLARFGVHFSRSLAVNLVPNNGVIKSYVNGFAAAYSVTNQDTSIYIRAGSFEVQSNLQVSFIDKVNNRNSLYYTVYSLLESSYFVETTLARAQRNDFTVTTSQRAVTGTRIDINNAGSSPINIDLATEAPFASPFAAANSYVTTQPFFLRAGGQYQFGFGLDCIVQIRGAARFFTGSTASCDASRSGYWNGITSATDEAGNPIESPDLIGEDGFNYRLASPLSPDALPAVPEPSTWVLLIGGLAMVGAMARRRMAQAT